MEDDHSEDETRLPMDVWNAAWALAARQLEPGASAEATRAAFASSIATVLRFMASLDEPLVVGLVDDPASPTISIAPAKVAKLGFVNVTVDAARMPDDVPDNIIRLFPRGKKR